MVDVVYYFLAAELGRRKVDEILDPPEWGESSEAVAATEQFLGMIGTMG